ncbi:MAG: T9SS type A sorting domain-containing protein [Ignavibacteriales bacterium]|nr:MAG: T9SS type A sorting domain-containing protein [Ignavibacteriaceae bacterium]MBW7874130.1 T9SS type A sorting domain-containing protein [Ignavibacteria bacterium]MCZ2142905.1 T9SS type A sorting domain-containing protein [Ignavibacteriales bacterium]OQY70202.1 MAG: hypothetical protein B6D45_11570 [Ignavibacteriales bacterium UTCHB3]MBV6444541.1 hypothetical protein [Ignavibacteriaceae bacterium]
MKSSLLFVVFLPFLFVSIFAQETIQITDISPDGKSVNTYPRTSNLQGLVIRTETAPFGTTPAWSAGLERQIGGLAFGDYDLDGDLDLAAGCYFSNSYPPIPEYNNMIFRNDNGALTVNPAWFSDDSRSTTDIKWADINGDGKPDLFSGNGDGSFAPSAIYFNNGSGVPTAPSFLFAGQAWTVGTAFGDINGDGLLDLAFANQGNTTTPHKPIYYYINQGAGFNQLPTYNSDDIMITNSIAFTDLNNSDLTRRQESFTVQTTGNAAFHLSQTPVTKIFSVTVNGNPTSNYCWDPVGAFVSVGGAVPAGATVVVEYYHVKKGDAGTAKWVNFASAFYPNNAGVIAGTPTWTVGNTISQKGCGWGDFDGDGYQDFVIGGSSNPHVIYKNNAGTLSDSPVWSSTISPNPGTQELIVNDVNNDGYPDFTTVSFSPPRVEIYLNDGGTIPTLPAWTYIGASSLNSIAYGDVNNDGMLDLAVGTARTPIVLFINQLAPIPVELTSFTADVTDKGVLLNWQTSTETNNREFTIERKTGDSDWNSIGTVPGSGTTTLPVSYSFTDCSLLGVTGRATYRLRQTDYDGTPHFLKPVSVEIDNPASFEVVGTYPNPVDASSASAIRIKLPNEAGVVVKVYDAAGRLVLSLNKGVMSAGTHDLDIQLQNAVNGVYFYSVEFNGKFGDGNGIVQSGKFLILK